MPERIPDLPNLDHFEEPERIKHREKMNELLT